MTKLSTELSQELFSVRNYDQLREWMSKASKELGGLERAALGGISNNVHTVEVASDPASAFLERPINSIDAMLELAARLKGETAPTPHMAAQKWYGIPAGGFAKMTDKELRDLANNIQVTMHESGTPSQPSVSIQDQGTGQHPDDFPRTLLSLLGDNKKDKLHVMGVYNAGGAACYKFTPGAIIVSRLAPDLLNGRSDEIGATVVLYNDLDVDKFKTGRYEYITAKGGDIIRLSLAEMPNGLPYGTYVMLLDYRAQKFVSGAHQPKTSLWSLCHAGLPNPPLPFRIIETRPSVLSSGRSVERRVVNGLIHQLQGKDVSVYSEEREVPVSADIGTVVLRYFVLDPSREDQYYVKAEQGLTFTLNGQRQYMRPRAWLKSELSLHYLFKRLIVVVDCNGLTSKAKRQVFASTRESAVDATETAKILEAVLQAMRLDDELEALDEAARQSALASSTRTTTEKVKKALAQQVAALLKGGLEGGKGGKVVKTKRKKKRKPPTPRNYDDSLMLEVPDKLEVLNDPLRVRQGGEARLRIAINAKNYFLPEYRDRLEVVFGPELAKQVRVTSTGSLLGGVVQATVRAEEDTPLVSSSFTVSLIIKELGVSLHAKGNVEVLKAVEEDEEEDSKTGGEPNVNITWVRQDGWAENNFDEQTVGRCDITRDGDAITQVEWVLNEEFGALDQVVGGKKLSEDAEKNFKERYGYAIALGLFRQQLVAEDAGKGVFDEDEEEKKSLLLPEGYLKRDRALWAQAVLTAMEPSLRLEELAEAEFTEPAGAA